MRDIFVPIIVVFIIAVMAAIAFFTPAPNTGNKLENSFHLLQEGKSHHE